MDWSSGRDAAPHEHEQLVVERERRIEGSVPRERCVVPFCACGAVCLRQLRLGAVDGDITKWDP